MNKLIILLLYTLVICTANIGCRNDSSRQNKPQYQQSKEVDAEKKKNNAKPLPPFSQLKKINKQTFGFIRLVNNKKVREEKQPILIRDERLIVKGNAIDQTTRTTASGIYLKIGNQQFKAQYGQPNKNLAQRLKNDKYLNSGFTAHIPTAKLKKGIQEITVLVVANDRKGYYEQKNKVKINVK